MYTGCYRRRYSTPGEAEAVGIKGQVSRVAAEAYSTKVGCGWKPTASSTKPKPRVHWGDARSCRQRQLSAESWSEGERVATIWGRARNAIIPQASLPGPGEFQSRGRKAHADCFSVSFSSRDTSAGKGSPSGSRGPVGNPFGATLPLQLSSPHPSLKCSAGPSPS